MASKKANTAASLVVAVVAVTALVPLAPLYAPSAMEDESSTPAAINIGAHNMFDVLFET